MQRARGCPDDGRGGRALSSVNSKAPTSSFLGGRWSWNLRRVPAFLCYFFFPLLAEEDSSRAAHARASTHGRAKSSTLLSLIPAGPLLQRSTPSILLLVAS
jgi:hypothetical protein